MGHPNPEDQMASTMHVFGIEAGIVFGFDGFYIASAQYMSYRAKKKSKKSLGKK